MPGCCNGFVINAMVLLANMFGYVNLELRRPPRRAAPCWRV